LEVCWHPVSETLTRKSQYDRRFHHLRIACPHQPEIRAFTRIPHRALDVAAATKSIVRNDPSLGQIAVPRAGAPTDSGKPQGDALG
jgi:hypothetical protein